MAASFADMPVSNRHPVLHRKVAPMTMISRFFKDESGATAIEYGLIAAATGLALVAALPAIETGLSTVFGSIGGALK